MTVSGPRLYLRCPECARQIEPNNNRQIYCGASCRDRARNRRRRSGGIERANASSAATIRGGRTASGKSGFIRG